MMITVEIHYAAASRAMQKGTFQLRGRKPEQVALQFWKEIKKEMSYRAELEKIIVEGDRDITEAVKALERQEWEQDDRLPF